MQFQWPQKTLMHEKRIVEFYSVREPQLHLVMSRICMLLPPPPPPNSICPSIVTGGGVTSSLPNLPPLCPAPPFVLPRGGGECHLVNIKFFVTLTVWLCG